MKQLKMLWVIILIVALIVPTTVYGATEITVDITKNDPVIVLSDSDERIFEVEYVFDVDFTHVTTGLDLVLVLDRSNSMLRPDPSSGLPVTDAVWKAVNTFVTEVYTRYPQSNVAIVSFGANGNKSDNWKYYNNLEDTLEEIEDVYEYRNLYTNYRSNFSAYRNNGYKYAWENWQISDGATNISAAFNYGATTVGHKQIVGESSDQDVIILFTDGVATQGGRNSEKNFNYPKTHNSNTVAAYTSGQEAQGVAEVITVGYFEGIEYATTKSVARETLELSQSAGFFEAQETGHLTGIFDTIVDELNYIGTEATVVEVVEDEFEVVENSVVPANYKVTVDDQGRQVITWKLGNVIDSDYTFGYKVKVKDHIYPTGSGSIEIPINDTAMLYYKDLNGDLVTETLGRSYTVIPPRSNQPLVNVDVTYKNGAYGYLLGDEIEIDHHMDFQNMLPFDYRQIDVNEMIRETTSNDLETYLALSEESSTAGWVLEDHQLSYNINKSNSVSEGDNLEWAFDVPIKLKTIATGNYQLAYLVDYGLKNSLGKSFEFNSMGNDPDLVDVIEGSIVLDLVDNVGSDVTQVEVYVDGVLAETELSVDNDVIIKGVTSGVHEVKFQNPSGYRIMTTANVRSDEDQNIVFDGTLSYDAPVFSKTIEFERLNIKDILITTRDDKAKASIDELDEKVEAKISFTLTRPLTQVSLDIVDDFVGSDTSFVLDISGGRTDVRNESASVDGFTMNGNRLEYNGGELAVGTYSAYGVFTSPALGNQDDYDYNVKVDQISTKENSDVSASVSTITSKALYVALVDVDGPVIDVIQDDAASTLNLINQDITITDKTKIVTFEVYKGSLTYEEILLETDLHEFDLVSNSVNRVELDSNISVNLSIETPGVITGRGAITIYAVDAFGNYSIRLVDYEKLDLQQLLEDDLV